MLENCLLPYTVLKVSWGKETLLGHSLLAEKEKPPSSLGTSATQRIFFSKCFFTNTSTHIL